MFSWRDSIYDLGAHGATNLPEAFVTGIGAVTGGSFKFGVNIGLDALIDGLGVAGIQLNVGGGFSITAGEGHHIVVYSVIIPLNNRK